MAAVGRPVAYYPRLARFLGSVNAAIFFSQLHYWIERTDDPAGVHKTADEWEEETGLSYREQVTARKILSSRGFMVEESRRLVHRTYYRLDMETVDTEFEAWDAKQQVDPTRVSRTTKTQFGGCGNVVRRTAETSFDIEHRLPETTAEKEHEPANSHEECPHQQIIDAFHEELPMCPRIRSWTPGRAKNLRARWCEKKSRQSVEEWRNLFAQCAESDFLTGRCRPRDGRKPFVMTLDWLVKPENFAKVIEGRYDNGEQA